MRKGTFESILDDFLRDMLEISDKDETGEIALGKAINGIKEKASKISQKTIFDELQELIKLEVERGVKFTLNGIKLPLKQALREAFGEEK
jgi:hypothetical protein